MAEERWNQQESDAWFSDGIDSRPTSFR